MKYYDIPERLSQDILTTLKFRYNVFITITIIFIGSKETFAWKIFSTLEVD